MASAEFYFAVHAVAIDDHKTMDLMTRLGVSQVEAFGLRCAVWAWGRRLQSRGVLPRLNDQQIAMQLRWGGEAKACIDALIGAVVLDRQDGVLTIHGWQEFQQPLIDKFENASARGRAARATQLANAKANVTTNTVANAGANAPTRKKEREIDKQQQVERVLHDVGVVGKVRRELAAKLDVVVVAEIVRKAKSGKPQNVAGLVVEMCRDEIETGEIAGRSAEAHARKAAAAGATEAERLRQREEAEQIARDAELNGLVVAWWRDASEADRRALATAVPSEFARSSLLKHLDKPDLSLALAAIARPVWESRQTAGRQNDQ